MNTMKTVEKIRQKIKELYDGEAPAHDQQCEFEDGYFTGIATISNFLDTLEESDKDLNEAARLYAIPHYTKDIDVNHIEEYPYDSGLEAAFKAGAEWRREQKDPTLADIAEKYAEKLDISKGWFDGGEIDDLIKESFKAGAEWQKDKDTRDMYMSDNRHFEKVYELGKRDMKAKMMEEAVEGEVHHCMSAHYVTTNENLLAEALKIFNDGDKVKIIVVKEDGK